MPTNKWPQRTVRVYAQDLAIGDVIHAGYGLATQVLGSVDSVPFLHGSNQVSFHLRGDACREVVTYGWRTPVWIVVDRRTS